MEVVFEEVIFEVEMCEVELFVLSIEILREVGVKDNIEFEVVLLSVDVEGEFVFVVFVEEEIFKFEEVVV